LLVLTFTSTTDLNGGDRRRLSFCLCWRPSNPLY